MQVVGLLCLVAPCGWAEGTHEDPIDEFARSLIKRWLWESGGAKKIKDVPAVRIAGTMSLPQFSVRFEQISTRDGYFFHEYNYPNGIRFREVVTPKRAWFEHSHLGGGIMWPAEVAERQRWLGPWLPLDWESGFRSARKLTDQQFEGRFSNVVELEPVEGGIERWYLDFSNGMLHTIVRPATDQRPLAAVRFDSWRELDGFAIPSRMTRFDAGSEWTIERDEISALDEVPLEKFRIDDTGWERATTVATVLKRYHQAIGGDTMLTKLRSRVVRQTIDVLSNGMVVRLISYRKFPNLALDVKHVDGVGTTWSGFNGKQGWEFSEITGFRLLEGAELQQMILDADLLSPARTRDQFRLVSDYRREETSDGVRHIARLSSFAAPAGEFHFNDKTGFVEKVISGVVAPGGGVLQVEMTLGGYVEYDGMWLPTKVHTTNPAIETITKIESVQHNVELPEELFAPRTEGVDYFPEFSRWEEKTSP